MEKSRAKWDLKDTMVLLRLFIGWHFLYEGVIKLYNPDWTSFGYLASAQGPFKSFFLWLSGEGIISIADWGNKIALIFVGISLLLGVFERIGAMVGIGLLALYYLAHPAFPGLTQLNVEGSYWFINKNLIELIGCIILFQVPTADRFGLKWIFNRINQLTKTEIS